MGVQGSKIAIAAKTKTKAIRSCIRRLPERWNVFVIVKMVGSFKMRNSAMATVEKLSKRGRTARGREV